MAKQVFENKDLVNLIYGFGPEHRAMMNKIRYSIRTRSYYENGGKALLSPVPNAMKYHADCYLFARFFVFKRCQCCSRHCHRKPNISLDEGMLVYDDGNRTQVPESKNKGDCDCNCRHTCRNMINRLMIAPI